MTAGPALAGPTRALVIVGAGGHGRETWDVVDAVNAEGPLWDLLGFLSDGGEDREPLLRRGLEVLGPTRRLEELDSDYVVAIGDSRARRHLCRELKARGHPATLVHPATQVANSAVIGPGSVVAAGTTLGAGVRLGGHVHLNVNVTVAEDAVLADFVTVSPGCLLGSGVDVGEAVFLGAGARVAAGRHIGPSSVIGAGAVVSDDIPAGCTAVGIPAHEVDRRPRC